MLADTPEFLRHQKLSFRAFSFQRIAHLRTAVSIIQRILDALPAFRRLWHLKTLRPGIIHTPETEYVAVYITSQFSFCRLHHRIIFFTYKPVFFSDIHRILLFCRDTVRLSSLRFRDSTISNIYLVLYRLNSVHYLLFGLCLIRFSSSSLISATSMIFSSERIPCRRSIFTILFLSSSRPSSRPSSRSHFLCCSSSYS